MTDLEEATEKYITDLGEAIVEKYKEFTGTELHCVMALLPDSVSSHFTRTEHNEFIIDIQANASLSFFIETDSDPQIFHYISGLKFPDSCCKCMGTVDHYEMIRHFNYSEDNEDPNVQQYGMYCFAIPFCQEHDIASNCFNIERVSGAEPILRVIKVENREWGALFSELNHIEGKWIEKEELRHRTFWGYFYLFSSMVLICIGIGVAFFVTSNYSFWLGVLAGAPIFIFGAILIGMTRKFRPDL